MPLVEYGVENIERFDFSVDVQMNPKELNQGM
jgi:hypothetical protein